MSYFDKHFYILSTNFSSFQIKLIRETALLIGVGIVAILTKLYIGIIVMLTFFLLDLIVFSINIYQSEKVYQKNFFRKVGEYDKIKKEAKSLHFKVNQTLAKREADVIYHSEAIKEMAKLDSKDSYVKYAQYKLDILDAFEQHKTIPEKDIAEYTKFFSEYETKNTIVVFESSRILLMMKKYDEAIKLLESFEYKKSIANSAYTFYSNILKYILYKKTNNSAKQEEANKALKSFMVISRFKVLYNLALKEYDVD